MIFLQIILHKHTHKHANTLFYEYTPSIIIYTVCFYRLLLLIGMHLDCKIFHTAASIFVILNSVIVKFIMSGTLLSGKILYRKVQCIDPACYNNNKTKPISIASLSGILLNLAEHKNTTIHMHDLLTEKKTASKLLWNPIMRL